MTDAHKPEAASAPERSEQEEEGVEVEWWKKRNRRRRQRWRGMPTLSFAAIPNCAPTTTLARASVLNPYRARRRLELDVRIVIKWVDVGNGSHNGAEWLS